MINRQSLPGIFTKALLSLSFALPFLSSCGYHFQGGETILPPDIKTVAINPVENNTTESGLGLEFQQALESRFDSYGSLKVIDDPGDADIVLTTKILSVESKVRNTTSQDVALELDLVMTISGELKRQNGQVLWRDSGLKVTQPFAGTGGVVVTGSPTFASGGIGESTLGSLDSLQVSKGQKDQALSDLVEEASRKLYLDAVAADF